jgi:K+-sensing histidine kinase KdpD
MTASRPRRRHARRSRRSWVKLQLVRFLASIAAVVLTTACAVAAGAGEATAALVLLVPVILSSLLGRRYGLTAAALATITFNYFFLAPTGTFGIDKVSDVIAFGVFASVALLIGSLVNREALARQQAEQRRHEADLSSTKAAFFAALGHNLRTPLTTVTTAVDSLLTASDEIDPLEQRVLLESIRDETNRLTLLVSRSLELGRVREGGLEPALVGVEVVAVVQSAIRRLGAEVGNRCDLEMEDEAVVVLADVAMTEEILAALIENAAAYAPGRVLIEIAAAGDWIDTSIVDHGPGIEGAERDRIFDEYVRGEQGLRTIGTGLGLATARVLAEAEGGRILLSDTPGGGATFTLRLPTFAGDAREEQRWPRS